jgi:hypothetical protein
MQPYWPWRVASKAAHLKFEEVLEHIPDNAKVLTSYGHALRYGGRGEDAAIAYQKGD